jgi:C-terminal processing protease CtpA/Prc
MRRPAKKWLVLGVLAGLAAIIWFGLAVRQAGQASAFAGLPVREQNLAVFDAACELLESNYYAAGFFQGSEWPALRREWRDKAAASAGGAFFYFNVLQNFATRLPASHVYFEQPPRHGAAAALSRKPTQAEERFANLIAGGPGFDLERMRRGAALPNVVGDVLRGSPAERAGVTPGWAVKEFTASGDGTDVHLRASFWPLDPAGAQLYERTGQLPELAPATVSIAYDYALPGARNEFELRRLPDGASYLRFGRFEDRSEVSRVLDAIDTADAAGLVLDLRHNTGGNAFFLGRILGRLLGPVQVGETIGREKRMPVSGLLLTGGPYEGPLVVLIGPTTASSAEIVAAAVQDLKRGLTIGRATRGAVLSGRFFDLPDGGKLAVPVGDYERRNGRRIEGVGVLPDIWILPTLEDVRAGRDPALERALEELRKAGKAPLNAPA